MSDTSERDHGPLRLAERILQILDQGSFSATYKYAVLIGLMDLCMERTTATGRAPDVLTTRMLAESVIALYWPHSETYRTGIVLRQSTGGPNGQAEILRRIVTFRERAASGVAASPSLARVRLERPDEYEKLLRFVEWKLIEMPLPRLQCIGKSEDRFLYDYNWNLSAIKALKPAVDRYQTEDTRYFDNRIILKPNVGECLIQLNGVLRPLIHQQWTSMVARMNKLPEAELEDFLFGAHRVSLDAVRRPLRELQGHLCFYCGDRIKDRWEVDHFIPWARYPDNGIDNLVASHESCNNRKRDYLAAAEHVERWRARARGHSADLAEIARLARWEQEPERTVSVARAIYQKLPDDTLLWRLDDDFVAFDRGRIRTALGAAA